MWNIFTNREYAGPANTIFGKGVLVGHVAGFLTKIPIIYMFQGEMTHQCVPMAMLAVCLFAGGSVTFMVPETRNMKLPNTVKDAEDAWGNKRSET